MHRLWIVWIAAAVVAQSPAPVEVPAEAVAVTVELPEREFRVEIAPSRGGGLPRTVWRGDRRAEAVAVVDEHRLLLEIYEQERVLAVLDVRTRRTREVARAYGEDVVAVYGDQIYFLRHRGMSA